MLVLIVAESSNVLVIPKDKQQLCLSLFELKKIFTEEGYEPAIRSMHTLPRLDLSHYYEFPYIAPHNIIHNLNTERCSKLGAC